MSETKQELSDEFLESQKFSSVRLDKEIEETKVTLQMEIAYARRRS